MELQETYKNPLILECIHHGKFTYYPDSVEYKRLYPRAIGVSMLPLVCNMLIGGSHDEHPCGEELIVISRSDNHG